MVDPIGPKGSTPTDLRVAPVAAMVAAPRVMPVAMPQTAVGRLATELAAQPPVDADRVTRIKAAIADGTFPILPATIADSLLALRYNWMSNDAS